ncbi:uncharacterized protein METZ01_LOCUS56558 [marine metagenome]|uniref:Uncharacterized protein n=1 Tax=marine metagenome TaxID=408172 RepID=A0A381SJT6_9ZZZZ
MPLTAIKSSFLSGAMAPIPLSKIPTLDRFAKPHRAYNMISLLRSDKSLASIAAKST